MFLVEVLVFLILESEANRLVLFCPGGEKSRLRIACKREMGITGLYLNVKMRKYPMKSVLRRRK